MNKAHVLNTETYKINITRMAVFGDKRGGAKGVLTLPSKVKRGLVKKGFDLTKSSVGKFIYAGIISNITITPKINKSGSIALQFTVNDPVQFKQLKIDGANSLVDGVLGINKRRGKDYPSLEFRINLTSPHEGLNGEVQISVLEAKPAPNEDRATELMRRLIENNKSFSANDDNQDISFESLSNWYDIKEIGNFRAVTKCIYFFWGTDKRDYTKKILYIGIVGDTKKSKLSKRNLTQRLNEHIEKKTDIIIEEFRFFELKDNSQHITPRLLKTLEMRIIQSLAILVPQEVNKHIKPLIQNGRVEINGTLCTIELINRTSKYHG